MFYGFEFSLIKLLSLFFFFFIFFKLSLKNRLFATLLFSENFFMFSLVSLTFVFVFIFNILSMVPYNFSMMSVSFSPFLGFSFWVFIYLSSIYHRFNSIVSHLLPTGTPTVLFFFMVCVEMVSMSSRPLALSVRIMANLTASHILLHLFSEPLLIYILIPLTLLFILEVSVAFIQAYVFSMLLSLYSQELS